MRELEYLCPRCKAALICKDNHFTCRQCPEKWDIVNGVVKLSRLPSCWSLLPDEEMRVFLTEVKSKGWKKAIFSSNNPKIKDLYLFADCPSRADGTFYLSLTPESRVLDLGSGWGSYTFALSPRVKQVVAADSNFESLEFISLRSQQEDRKNIITVQIDPLDFGKIPFADNSFDAVIMNGVLEWVGAYFKKGDPLRIQRNCLKEIRRILKPGGEVWIGIENRFGLRYLSGAADDHLNYYSKEGISYTTVFPRFIASWITKWKLGISYRTYTHSLWGCKRLLRSAGFKTLEFYYPESDYRAVSTRICPLSSREVKERVGREVSRKRWLKFLSSLNLETALCDSYFIKAKVEA